MAERISNPGVMPHGERVATVEATLAALITEVRRASDAQVERDKAQTKQTADNHAENTVRLKDLDGKVTKTNGRVRSLEIWKAMMLGAIGVLSFILAELGKPIIDHWLK